MNNPDSPSSSQSPLPTPATDKFVGGARAPPSSFPFPTPQPSSSPTLARPTSLRETFSAPPLLPRSRSHSHSYSYSYSGTNTPSRPSTAASSALALAQNAALIPGLGAPLPFVLPDGGGVEDVQTPGPGKRDPPMASTLLVGKIDKPWLAPGMKEGRVRLSWWITFCTALLGLAASAGICYNGWRSVPGPLADGDLCLVLSDDFDTFNVDTPGATWRREVDLGGFGNGQFEMTTPSPSNSFTKNGLLYISPTLTADAIPGGNASVFDGAVYNATGCTSATNLDGTACGARSNATSGTVINPVQSARLTTQLSHSIQFGKVEIRARMPRGDWLWLALWMLPVNETYGPWPLSGEIDIMESRGNDASYPSQGNNVVRASLNWGPTLALNAVFKTYGWWLQRRTSYADDFHTYTLEWTQDFIRIYVDTRLHRMIDLRLTVPFFERGDFPPVVQNNSQTVALQNPWVGRGNAAPFDQPFFLIMDVAVGGTNGWFPDNVGNKPWVDGSATAMRDFALAQDKWYPTWPQDIEQRALVVDYVKMWQLCRS